MTRVIGRQCNCIRNGFHYFKFVTMVNQAQKFVRSSASVNEKNLNHEGKVLKIPPLQQETIERMVWTIFFLQLETALGRAAWEDILTRKWTPSR